jgi:hypothetical protein
MSVIAVVVGVAALLIGAFVAPIPSHVSDALQLATAIFIRGILALIALAVAITLAYIAGYRIQSNFEPVEPTVSPAVSTSPILALFTTPGPRRDALFVGSLTLIAYWFFTTLYIAALGRSIGGLGLSGSVPSFILSRLALGLALAAAGGGAGALGARNAFTRSLTQRIFTSDSAVSPSKSSTFAERPRLAQTDTEPRLPAQSE